MTESTNLPAVLSESAQRFMSTTIESSQASLPFAILQIIQEMGATTPERQEIPVGSFAIKDTEVFGKTVKFRPIAIANKVMRRAGPEDNYRVVAETVYFHNFFSGERLDTLGGVDCGRKWGKATSDMTQEQQDLNSKRGKIYTHAFGMATIGDNDPILVMISLPSGAPSSKGRRIQDATNVKTLKADYRTKEFELSLVLPTKDPLLSAAEQKAAQNKHFNLIVKPNMAEVFTLQSIAEEGGIVMDYIAQVNARVVEQHKEAVQKKEQGEVLEGEEYFEGSFEEVE